MRDRGCDNLFRMFEGYYGPYFTPTVDAEGNLSWTNNAGLPNPAAINIKGAPGTGLEISGLVATEADLPATAEDWTCYLVGTEVPYTVYTYNPNNGWISLGQLASGPKGDPGDPGTTFTPSVSAAGIISWTNDGDLPNPQPVDIKGPKGDTGETGATGPQGPTGPTGPQGPAYTLTEEDKAEIVADVVDEIPLVDPDAKTSAQTQPVGVDANGKLWTAPGGQGGSTDYDQLSNRPSINGHTLTGNQTAAQLGLATPSDIPSVPVQSVNGKTGAVVLNAADVGAGTYSKPSGGIPKTDLASAVQASLGKADTAYQKPSSGIPAADLASGVIPTVPSAATATPANLGTAAVGSSSKYAREDHVHNKPTYTAADVGAIAAPASPATGAFLVWNGSAWVAQTLSTWQASSY